VLSELTITNFAIIDRLHLTLAPDFSVLTGETGAGKSIIIDAMDALLGGKYGAEFIRSGSESARIEGIFRLPESPELADLLVEYGIEVEDASLILSREIHSSGRSTLRVNGRALPGSVVQDVAQVLLDIHGQSEHLSLLRVSEHINFLDRYAAVASQRAQVAEKVALLRAVRRELQSLMSDERELARRVDLLRFQVDEISTASLHAGEEEELSQERVLLSNAEKLAALTEEAYQALYEGSDEQRAVIDLLGQVSQSLGELARLDPTLADYLHRVDAASEDLSDLAHTVRAYRDRIEFNPERLQEVEERLSLIQSLKRKYGLTIADILTFGERSAQELDNISHSGERIAELQGQEDALLHEIGRLAAALSQLRRVAGEDIARRLEKELADLEMRYVRFEVAITNSAAEDGVIVEDAGKEGEGGTRRGGEGETRRRGDAGLSPGRYAFDATGIDRVEFLISPNPGEPLRPLTKIASGGETARVMLALKSILSAVDEVPTLIFDEIDVGIGGRSGHVVGEKLWRLTPKHQVICITHLPQVAAFGDRHFTVAKQVIGNKTVTAIRELSSEERVQEVAAMLGSTSDLSQQAAREILKQAQDWKHNNS
jgi:DNA repair protein RecN (Recombination protein N)